MDGNVPQGSAYGVLNHLIIHSVHEAHGKQHGEYTQSYGGDDNKRSSFISPQISPADHYKGFHKYPQRYET